ncbi:neurofilament medium polypeptide-like, partial [Sarcophilus harrisii]|uniref:neurofilament medium polypeptide-like n=1 Tax=Sarcophilus harrisii TaxID=9305 RepID=UPI001301C363
SKNPLFSTEVRKSPLKEDEAAEASAEQGIGSDTGSKFGVVLEKPVPKKPSEPPVQKEEAKQSKNEVGKSPLKEDEAAEASAEPGSGSDTGSKVGVVLEKPVAKKPSEPPVDKEEATQSKKEVGKSPLKEDEAAEASAEPGSGSDTGSKVGVVLEKPVPKKPSEPPVDNEEATQKVGKSPLKEDEAAEASAEPGSGSDTGSKVGVILEKPVPQKPSEPPVQKEEAKQSKKGKG